MTANELRIVIVGASLAGIRAAEELRRRGHTGPLTIIGDEEDPPYDRTPLSKALLLAPTPPALFPLGGEVTPPARWMLGRAAVSLDRRRREVTLSDGSTEAYDRLLIATGRRARPWHVAREAQLNGVLTLRTLEDGRMLASRLTSQVGPVVIVGAGFIGSEVASAFREAGREVSVVSHGATPLQSSVGSAVGSIVGQLYAEAGVRLRLGRDVAVIDSDPSGRVSGVILDDGEWIEAQTVLVATGTVPNIEWLDGSGLETTGGVAVDEYLRAVTTDGDTCPNICAAGDVTRWRHPLFGRRSISIEHWGTAVEQGRVAARTLLGGAEAPPPYSELPRFWSSMFGVNIKSIGVPALAEDVVAVQGSLADRRGVVVYGAAGRCVGAVSFDAPRDLPFYEPLIERGEPFPPRIDLPRWGTNMLATPVPAGFPRRDTIRAVAAEGEDRPGDVSGPVPVTAESRAHGILRSEN